MATRAILNRSAPVEGEFGQVVDRRKSVNVLRQDVAVMPRGTTVTFEDGSSVTVDRPGADNGIVLEAWVK